MSTYSGRFYEGRYIQGIISAKMSKSGVLGYIASFPIPEVISGINATILGAQTINPNIKIKIIWANTWFDPGKEADAAKALIDQGADVIMQHTDSPAAMQVAAERGKLAFGQDSEMIKFGPKTQLTSIMNNWGPYYVERVKAELDGTWKSEDFWGGLKSKLVVMAPYTNMPDDVKKLAMEPKRRSPKASCSVQMPGRRPGRQGSRMQGRHPPRRRPDARHELLRQGHRRQDPRQVGRARCPYLSPPFGGERSDRFDREQNCENNPMLSRNGARSFRSRKNSIDIIADFAARPIPMRLALISGMSPHPSCIARAAALWRRIRSGTSRPGIAPSVTTQLPPTITRSARCAPHSTSAASGSP